MSQVLAEFVDDVNVSSFGYPVALEIGVYQSVSAVAKSLEVRLH